MFWTRGAMSLRGQREKPEGSTGGRGMAAEQTGGAECPQQTGGGDTLVVGKDTWTGLQAPDRSRDSVLSPKTHSTDPCSGALIWGVLL